MNQATEQFSIDGPSGMLEALRDRPSGVARGVAVISHPHPLFGGTMDNKVVQTLARAFVQCGWEAIRFNFRGVGRSAGQFDEGRGETGDLHAVIQHCVAAENFAIAGFSFGSYVSCREIEVCHAQRAIEKIVLVGTAASRFPVPPLPAHLHERSLIIHGESDDTVPLADVMAWARPQILPVTVVPGGGHFFHGQLPLLKSLVVRHLLA
jgi:uncharacterized protein